MNVCPAFTRYKYFTYSGGGKCYTAQGILEGALEPDADMAGPVTDDDHGAEAERPAALVHLGDAVDLDDALLERELVGIDLGHGSLPPIRSPGRLRGRHPPATSPGRGT